MVATVNTEDVYKRQVFPHNLRRLFATVFDRACRDIVQLADVLGHSSIETTRLYLMTSGAEHRRQLERLGLVAVSYTHLTDWRPFRAAPSAVQ